MFFVLDRNPFEARYLIGIWYYPVFVGYNSPNIPFLRYKYRFFLIYTFIPFITNIKYVFDVFFYPYISLNEFIGLLDIFFRKRVQQISGSLIWKVRCITQAEKHSEEFEVFLTQLKCHILEKIFAHLNFVVSTIQIDGTEYT